MGTKKANDVLTRGWRRARFARFALFSAFIIIVSPPAHGADGGDDGGWRPSIPLPPLIRTIIAHPKDAAAIRKLVAGEWRVIATYGFEVLAKDAPQEVLGKTGRIVLEGKDPKVLMFEYGTEGCTPAKPAAVLSRWEPLEIPPRGYSQTGWSVTGAYLAHGDTSLEEFKKGRLKTWNGKPLSREQLKALEPLFRPYPESQKDPQWLLIGFANRCAGKGHLVRLLEPTRGGMLVQYYVDGFLIYERVR